MNEFTGLDKFQKRGIHEYIIENMLESFTQHGKDTYLTFGMEVLDDIPGLECIEESKKVDLLKGIWNEFSKTL